MNQVVPRWEGTKNKLDAMANLILGDTLPHSFNR